MCTTRCCSIPSHSILSKLDLDVSLLVFKVWINGYDFTHGTIEECKSLHMDLYSWLLDQSNPF
jgi:hypothetical protein